MATPEIVWVFGASAAGKETFIHNVVAGHKTVEQEFGWQSKRIGTCKESMEWVAKYPGDIHGRAQRPKLADIVPALADTYDVVLVKGQDYDLGLGIPLQIKQQLPQALHRIVFIDVGLDELFERVVHKPWWNQLTKRAEEEGWLEEQIDRLMEIQDQFNFTAVDGSALGNYEKEDFKGNFI